MAQKDHFSSNRQASQVGHIVRFAAPPTRPDESEPAASPSISPRMAASSAAPSPAGTPVYQRFLTFPNVFFVPSLSWRMIVPSK